MLSMRLPTALLLCLSMASTAHAQATVRDAVPSPAIPAILDLFKHYQMVGLGEGPHGNREGHLFRVRRQQLRRAWEDTTNPGTNWDKQGRGFKPASLTNLVEREGVKLFTISTRYGDLLKLQPTVASWKSPAFAMLRGTVLGKKFYAQYYPLPPAPGWNTVLMEEQFDGVLYLGPAPPTMTLIPPSLCRDADYMKMRLARLAITSARTDSSDPAGSLRKLCADLTRPR